MNNQCSQASVVIVASIETMMQMPETQHNKWLIM